MKSRIIVGAAVALMMSACGSGSSGPPPEAAQEVRGDTTFVSGAPGVLGASRIRVAEALRVGSLDGESATAFGEITHLTGLEDGGFLAFDAQVPALQRFDSEGGHLRTIGREGEGPGEYSSDLAALTRMPDGRIVMYDRRRGRISLYSADGEFLESSTRRGGFGQLGALMLTADTAGRLYVLDVLHTPGAELPTPWPFGIEVRTPEGAVLDTLVKPRSPNPSVFEVHPFGHLVSIPEDRYELRIARTDGSQVRISYPTERVELTESERQAAGPILRQIEASDRGREDNEMPAVKSVVGGVRFDNGGRIWVARVVSTPRGETPPGNPLRGPVVWDAFTSTGDYLGTAEFPYGVEVMSFVDDVAFGVATGRFDEQYAVRYGLSFPN